MGNPGARYTQEFMLEAVRMVRGGQSMAAVAKILFMAARGLELSEEKTRITHISEGFDFLGQNVRKYDGKLLIKPAKKSIKSLLDKVRSIIKGYASATQ